MSNFIERTDYDAALHREILSSLLRETSAGGQPNPDYNPQVIEACEDNAIALMRSYLSNSYDCEAIFSARGAERHQLILMFAVDIAVYNILSLSNPQKMSKTREERYTRAIEWLKEVYRRDLPIEGAPRLPKDQQEGNSPWQIQADNVRPTLL